jgi:hypothetical protein
MNGTFVAVANTINGLASGDYVLYLPLNVAYGTSNTNCVWFRFDLQLNPDGTTSWFIWDVRGPGTSDSDYHYTVIGIPYTLGDGYNFALTTSGTNTVTFSIKDTTTGASWSTSTWAWTVPSLNLRYDTSMYSPASVIQGATTNNQLANVPFFQTTVGYGMTTYWFSGYGSSIPSSLGIFVNAGPSGYYYWAMDSENYVSSINSYGHNGAGSVANPNNLIGIANDGLYTTLYGGNLGDGGWIIGNMNTAATGHVYVYGYSSAGYYTHLIVSVSYDGSSWTTISSQTINPTSSPYYIDCGSTASIFMYIKLNATDDNWYSARLFADAVHVIRPSEYYVSSINSYGYTGAGSVANPNSLIGSVNDGLYTTLYGGNYGDGGWIIGNMNTAATGHVYVYGYSSAGYYTHLIVSVSYDGSSWTTISSQTINPTSSPYSIDCGSTAITFRYIKLNAIDDTGMSARLFADAVHVVGSNRYAILIAGGWDAQNNWARYYNDMMFMYDCLTARYGYTADTTYVLYADGQQPTANNCPDPANAVAHANVIDRSATPANVQWAFGQVAARAISDDFVFVFTTDHGSNQPAGHTYLCLWGQQQVSDTDFAGSSYLGAIRAYYREVITMEQCYSGGFVNPMANTRRTIATACTATQVSWACDTEGAYDEFVYHWISAVNWANPNGQAVNADTNGDGRISMTEAFRYAVAHDSRTETPQWSDLGNTGTGIFLSQW